MYGDGRQPPRRPHPAEAPTEIIRPVRPPDPPTEYIPVYRDSADRDEYYDDDDDYYEDDELYDEPPRRKSSPGLIAVRSVGELLITAGLVVLLFVVYEVWITDIISAEKQAEVTTALEDEWKDPAAPDPERTEHFSFADGEGIAKLYVPALGSDY